MLDSTFHIRIKKEYAAALIEDLIKVHAVEAVEQEDEIELTTRQKEALDKELAAVAANPSYLQRWDDVNPVSRGLNAILYFYHTYSNGRHRGRCRTLQRHSDRLGVSICGFAIGVSGPHCVPSSIQNYSERRLSVGLMRAARMTRRLMVRRLIVMVIRPASTKIHQERVMR
jgi:hypothetical protein